MWVVSNNNRYTPTQICSRLKGANICVPERNIITSLVHVRDSCKELLKQAPVYVWGTGGSINWLSTSGVHVVDCIDDAEAVALLYRNDYNYSEIVQLCNAIKRTGKFIVGNIDATYPDKHDTLPDTGSLMKLVMNATGVEPLRKCGKPSHEMFQNSVDKPALMLGDSMKTDYYFAKNCGMEFILVSDKPVLGECNDVKAISHLAVLADYIRLNRNKNS